MKKTYLYLVIILFSAAAQLKSQCPDIIQLCFQFTNEIIYEQADGQYEIVFYDHLWMEMARSTAVCKDSILTWKNDANLPSIGFYNIYTDSLNFCSGTFFANACKDEIFVLSNDYCILPESEICGDTFSFNSFSLGFCQNDTVLFSFGEYRSARVYVNEKFGPERLVFDNGELISYTDSTFTMVMSKPGKGCMELKTENDLNEVQSSFLSVLVWPEEKQKIYHLGKAVDSLVICEGDSISLELALSGSTFWQLSDGRNYYHDFQKIPFAKPGQYLLTVYPDLYCDCTLPSELVIMVMESVFPKINCARSVCLHETVIYSTDNACGTYIWTVGEGGSIVNGGGLGDNYVEVTWHSGQQSSVALQTPNCVSSFCEKATTETIEIINPNINITGPDKLCDGEISTYEIPAYTGTFFQWTISNNGEILSGQGTNKILVKWKSPVPVAAKVSITYENCNIDCKGFGELPVVIKPVLEIFSPNLAFCINHEFKFRSTIGDSLHWRLLDENHNEIHTTTDSSMVYLFTEAQNYILIVNDFKNISCNVTDTLFLKVDNQLLPPAKIIGPKVICINKQLQYSISDVQFGETIVWEVFDGDTFVPAFTQMATDIIYLWKSAGPYLIKVKKINTISGCESEVKSFSYFIENNIDGSDRVCINTNNYYFLEEYTGEVLKWTISPANAGFIQSSSQGYVYIKWTRLGKHKLSTSYCGKQSVIEVVVSPKPLVDVEFDSYVCYNELSKVVVNVAANEKFKIYQNGVLKSSSNPTYLPRGYYFVEVDKEGCTASRNLTINEYSKFEIEINLLQSRYVCSPFQPLDLYISNPKSTYTYQWFYNNKPIPNSNTPTIKADKVGFYHLVVTNSNGCIATSEGIEIIECCPMSIQVASASSLNIATTHDNCVKKTFEVVPPFQSTKFNWNFGEFLMPGNNTATGLKVSHTYSKAGLYFVTVYGNAGCTPIVGTLCSLPINDTICENDYTKVIIPVVADFFAFNGCVNSSVTFNNTTTSYPANINVSYEWNFGDPTSGASNYSTAKTPLHTYKKDGLYQVTLIAKTPDGCSDTLTRKIIIEQKPEVDINSVDESCEGDRIYFSSTNTGALAVEYKWNFGDAASGTANNSTFREPSHIYNSPGTFLVSLTVESINGCKDTDSKYIKVWGDFTTDNISCNLPLPKCEDDVVELTAPNGNYTYLWNTGETTRTIQVSQASTYRVTITNDKGCSYVPPGFRVYNHDIFNGKIFARKFNSNTSFITYYDSLEICKGDSFVLQCLKFPNADFIWSNGHTKSNEVEYRKYLKDLSPGRHTISLIINSQIYNCGIETPPFIIKILDAPVKPIIQSDNPNNCDDENILLHIANKIENVNYTWSNGAKTDTIAVKAAGKFQVTAQNDRGCKIVSNDFIIYPTPSANEWITGCLEVCLPKDFCINFKPENQYQLIRNGIHQGMVDNTKNTLELNEVGDYQVRVINPYGCDIISDLLNVKRKPNVHSLQGLVFYDVNENDVFDDAIDIVLNNVPIQLKKDNVIYHSTQTNETGQYSFDSLWFGNMDMEVFIEDLDYTLKGKTDSVLTYVDCIENKILNFPLIKDCRTRTTNILASVCHGETIMLNNKTYHAFDTDTLVIAVSKNCDSTVYIRVEEKERPLVNLTTELSCLDRASGELKLDIIKGNLTSYAIDGKPVAINNEVISGIDTGQHILTVFSHFGCKEEYDFEIKAVQPPQLTIDVTPSCANEQLGTLLLISDSASGIKFSIDEKNGFVSQPQFDSLAIGQHIVYIKDTMDCLYERTFQILPLPLPQFNIKSYDSCPNTQSGRLEIISNDTYYYAINQDTLFTAQKVFENLPIGIHFITATNEYHCIDTATFTINDLPEPIIALSATNSCSGLQEGSISIQYDSMENLLFKINEDSVWQDINYFQHLSSGEYQLWYKDTFGCQYSSAFLIDTLATPDFNFTVYPSCEEQENGSVTLSSGDQALVFSLNAKEFVSDSVFMNLTSGDHIIYAKNAYGCLDTQRINVPMSLKPAIQLETLPGCENNRRGEVKIEPISGLTYSLDNKTFSSVNVFTELNPGQYTLYFKNADQCMYTMPFGIDQIAKPVYDVVATNSCWDKENGEIDVVTKDGDLKFSFNGGAYNTLNHIENLPAGNYTMVIKNNYDCIYFDSVQIGVFPKAMVDVQYHNSCTQKNTGFIEVKAESFMYTSLDGIHYTSNLVYDSLSPQAYTIFVKDSFGCVSSFSDEVSVFPPLEVEIPVVETNCEEEAATISVEVNQSNGRVKYEWQTGENTPSIMVRQPALYTIVVRDDCDSRSFDIEVDFEVFEEDRLMVVPNIFKPKSSLNACFKPVPITELPIMNYHLSVFDRWGNLYFETTNINDCWNGTLNNVDVVPGVYVYMADFTVAHCNTLKKVRKVGDVTVVH